MKYRMLDILACPSCDGRLSLSKPEIGKAVSTVQEAAVRNPHCELYCGKQDKSVKEAASTVDCRACYGQEILAGTLVCTGCKAEYPIRNGIPRMVNTKEDDEGKRQVKNRFEFQWATWGKEEKIFGRTQEENTECIRQGHSLVRTGFLKGKVAIDGGCGHGRYLNSFSSLGAEVVGIDFGSGVEVAAKFNAKDGMVHVIQGDLLNPPIRASSIDFSFSFGVIHHTPDPRKAFKNLARMTRSGGLSFIWVYPKGGPAWEISQKLLRAILTRLPARLLYYLCFIPVPMLAFVKTYSNTSLKTASWYQCAQVIYDWYSPTYQFHYTEDELRSWFKEEGFDKFETYNIATGIGGQKV